MLKALKDVKAVFRRTLGVMVDGEFICLVCAEDDEYEKPDARIVLSTHEDLDELGMCGCGNTPQDVLA